MTLRKLKCWTYWTITKSAVLSILRELMETPWTVKTRRLMSQQIKIINKEIGIIKKNQADILEMISK